jgi:hypothetical protein
MCCSLEHTVQCSPIDSAVCSRRSASIRRCQAHCRRETVGAQSCGGRPSRGGESRRCRQSRMLTPNDSDLQFVRLRSCCSNNVMGRWKDPRHRSSRLEWVVALQAAAVVVLVLVLVVLVVVRE